MISSIENVLILATPRVADGRSRPLSPPGNAAATDPTPAASAFSAHRYQNWQRIANSKIQQNTGSFPNISGEALAKSPSLVLKAQFDPERVADMTGDCEPVPGTPPELRNWNS
jgi:hypothetical protein